MKRYSGAIAIILMTMGFLLLPQIAKADTTHVVFSDSFQDANGTSINAHNPMWNCEMPTGSFLDTNTIQNNSLPIDITQGCTPPAVTNGSIQYTAVNHGFNFSIRGLPIRYSPIYQAFEVIRYGTGYWNTLAYFNAFDGQPHTYKWDFNGPILTLSIDGSVVYSDNDLQNLLTGTYQVDFTLQDIYNGATPVLNSFTVTSYDSVPNTIASLSPVTNSLGYYGNPTTITLQSLDASGITIANTYYTVDSGSQQTYTAPFTVSNSGSHKITFWSVDSAGVAENPNTLTFVIGGEAVTSSHTVFSDNFQAANGTGINTHQPLWNCNNNDNVIQNNSLFISTSTTCNPPVVTNGSIQYTAINHGFNFNFRGLAERYSPIYQDFEKLFPGASYWQSIYSFNAFDGQPHTYKWDFNQAILTLYIDGKMVYSAPDLTGLLTGTYNVGFTLQDIINGATPVLNSFTVTSYDNAAPTVNSLSNTTINEGDSYSASGSFTDPDSTSWTGTVDYGEPGVGAQPIPSADIDPVNHTFHLSHTYLDEGATGSYTVTVVLTDNQGASSAPATATITVNNAPFTVSAITAPTAPTLITNQVSASATFSYTNPVSDTHTATWYWGDGSTSSGTVTEPNGSTPGSVSGSHTYSSAGVYAVNVIVTDEDGLNESPATPFQYLTIYDPAAGRLDASQKYSSPASADLVNGQSGNVNFGVHVRYLNGSPTGTVQFRFKQGNTNIEFDNNAATIQWLTISGSKATVQGTTTLKGQTGTYTFFISAIDNNQNLIRFRITDPSNNVIYDTQPGATDSADPTTAIANGGKVQILP